MNNLYNSLMAYRQRGGGRGPQLNRQMGRPMGQQQSGGYDSSGINPGGGMSQPPQASPMQPPQMPMGGATAQPPMRPPMTAPQPMQPRPMPAPQAPGGYDGSGINPSAGRPFQLQGGFTRGVPQSNDPILYNQMPGTSAS